MANVKTATITADMCDKELLQQGTIKLLEPIKEKCNVNIPKSIDNIEIVKISDNCFSDSTGVTSINIPNSVTSIGNYTFAGCTNLTSIDIPNSITSIGEFAFNNCTNLTSVDIPNSVISIGYAAFSNCESLKSINVPSSVASIGNCAFDECRNLTIIYEENREQLNKLLTSKLKAQLNKDNISAIPIKDIKSCIYQIKNCLEYSIPEDFNLVYKKYFLKELDNAINNTSDLNKKINLLTARSNIDMQPICINSDDIEK